MKAFDHHFTNAKGFTLIEIIVTLTLSSVLAIVIILFIEAGMKRSSEPVYAMHEEFAVNSVIENISADYRFLLLTSSTPLMDLKTYIENGNDADAASSAGTNYYGDYQYELKFITFDASYAEAAAPCTTSCNILKVTLSKGNHTLKTLFTK